MVIENGHPTERKNWFPDIEPLFKLLSYENVPPYLKGALRNAISTFVHVSPVLKDTVWSYLEQYDLPLVVGPPIANSAKPMATQVAQKVLRRELEPWETIAVGALSGGLAAVTTTPFDVMKTRMMTAQGRSLPMSMVFMSIVRREGPLGLFKGALPRFFWIAPLGAMNFAGYELARKAMDKHEESTNDQISSQKKLTTTV